MFAGGLLLLAMSDINVFELTLSSNTIKVSSPSMPRLNQASISNVFEGGFLIKLENREYPIKAEIVQSWFEEYYRPYTGRQELRPNVAKIQEKLDELAKQINFKPYNGRFEIDKNGQISELIPARDGLEINTGLSVASIASALMQGKISASLVYGTIKPQIDINKFSQLGINTLLGKGESNFSGSSLARIHNIETGSKNFDGIILKPGEEFSFNELIGPIEASNGYQYELVIKNQKLIPEYGGGLCQVSTTIFRAAMMAGLPILERHPHSLPVRYYSPQGFDATIYPGISDLRFKNDTLGHMLIQAEVTSSSLHFEIYGSADGRKVSIDGPHAYDVQPDGSMKAWLKRIVTSADGVQQKDVFYSNYKSPSLFARIRNPLE